MNSEPTAQQVAARAGVALRTLYHHFEDMEALRRAALEFQVSRHYELLEPVEASAGPAERVAAVARQLRRLFEATGPIRQATIFDEHSSEEMAGAIDRLRQIRRAHLERTFAQELRGLRAGSRSTLDALEIVTSWQSWHHLRCGLGRGQAASERTLAHLMRSCLRVPTTE